MTLALDERTDTALGATVDPSADSSHDNHSRRRAHTAVADINTIEMGARQYLPAVGRFLQVDPVEGGSANDYDYCNGEPVNCTDLSGTSATDKYGTYSEKVYCLKRSHAYTCAMTLLASRIALSWARSLFGSGFRNYRSFGDAFLHVAWMAVLTHYVGPSAALAAGYRHEAFPHNNAATMAYYNNSLGVHVGVVERYTGASFSAIRSAALEATCNGGYIMQWHQSEASVCGY